MVMVLTNEEVLDKLLKLDNVDYKTIYEKAKEFTNSNKQFNIVMLEGRKRLNCFR